MQVDDVVGAAFLPTDGQASPSTSPCRWPRARAKRASPSSRTSGSPASRSRGAASARVVTDEGPHHLRKGRHLRRANGRARSAAWPASTSRSYRCSTNISSPTEFAGVTPDLPTLRDPDRLTYWKEEVGRLVMGGYEPNPKPWADGRHSRGLRVPTSRRRPRSFRAAAELAARPRAGPADGRHQAVHQRPGKLHARWQFHPRRGAGGARHLCRRRLQRLRHRARAAAPAWRSPSGSPTASRPSISGRSTSAASARTIATPSWVRTRTLEAYAKHYTMAWPFEEYRSGRPLAPLAALRPAEGARRLLRRQARLGAAELVCRSRARGEAEDIYSYGRQNWFEAVGREHAAARERVAIFDQTSFAKFLLVGRDAEKALSWIAANDVAQTAGTPRLHADAERARRHRMRPHGRAAVADRILHRHRHRLRHPRLRLDHALDPGGLDARLIDVTSAYAVLSLMGPRSRELLQRLTEPISRTPASPSAG